MTGTNATAIVNLHAIKRGDCGSDFTFTASLDAETDNIMPYVLTVDDSVFSDEGMTITQVIPRESKEYELAFTLTAEGAQSVEEHQAMTTDTGFENKLTDSVLVVALSTPDSCNPSIISTDWLNFREESDYTGPMLS